MSPTSVKKTQQQYQSVVQRLENKLLHLRSRREMMDTRAFVVLDEGGASVDPHAPTASRLDENPDLYHGEVGSLVSTATDIIIKALEIKLSYVKDVLERLSLLVNENPRQATPTELLFSHYEEWLESNQQLFEFNSQLYDLERVKFDLKHKHDRVKTTPTISERSEVESSTRASQLASNSISQAQNLLLRFHRQSHASNTTRVYIHERLNPRGGKMTLESQKVQEYIAECFQYADADPNEVKGVHRESYQEFMGVLCSYIVEKQKEWQREDISYELVYSAVEHCVMPQLKTLVLSRVAQPERDDVITKKCHAFSDITLDQLRVRPQLQSNEVVPFIDSITQIRASYFSSTPTDKMYSIVAAVKALYDQLGSLEETSIDGDAFLDLWIYVIIKANVKDLATNLRFMIEYGNPQLANGEAGYYLTTLEAAVQFIATLTPQTLKNPSRQLEFVVCECAHFSTLCSLPGSGMEMVTREVEIQGYRVAILRDWALNRARLFRSALVPTANYSDTAKVAVIRVNQENTHPAMVQYLLKQFSADGLNIEGLFSKTIPLGTGIFVNMSSIDHHNVILLPSGDYDHYIATVNHILQLQRLGGLPTDPRGPDDSCLIYPPHSTHNQTLNIPTSPPYNSSTRGMAQLTGGDESRFTGGQERRTGATPSSLWSPYVLGRTFSPEGNDRSHEVSFTHKVNTAAQLSHTNEHRQLNQQRQTPESLLESGSSRTHSLYHPHRSVSQTEPNSRGPGATSHSFTVTIEAEVHESPSKRDPSPQRIGRGDANVHSNTNTVRDSDSEEGRDECMLNLLAGSGGGGGAKRKLVEVEADCRVVENSARKEREEQRAQRDGDCGDNGDKNGSEHRRHLKTEEISHTNASVIIPEDILSPQYREELEEAFITNHLYGNRPQSIVESVRSTILQTQMYLQRLNYLSVSYKITGKYDDVTLQAVKTFQSAHNHHEAQYSVALPENGHLTSPTYQFLRQAFLTIYASMLRLGLDKYLGETFDPMSSSPRDLALFRDCVSELQKQHGLKECQTGALCANTMERVKQLLKEPTLVVN